MKIDRTKNAGRNIVFGCMLKIYQIVMPFIMRTLMIYYMGIQYLGLNSLFTSILQVLNLAELGVGSAMVYSMYKPIAVDDKKMICALMKLYRTYYRVIGIIIAFLGLCLVPFIPKLIKSDVPADINIYVLYILNLSVTVLSYWLFAYKNCLLDAHQRTDVASKVTLVTNTLQYIVQFFTLCFLKNYYAYIIVSLAAQALTNILTAVVTTHMYPDYRPDGNLSKEVISGINRRIRDLFTSKLGVVIVNSADTIVISAFLGLTILAIYQNYFFIMNSIISIVTIIFAACTAGIGNSIIVETKEKNFADLRKFTLIITWIAGFCAICLLCLYQPFMEIWVGSELKLNFLAVVFLCIYYFVYEVNQLFTTYKDAAGMWHEDRFRPLVTALANLIMNLLMVQFWGIYGVIISTVISTLFIGMPWLLHNLFTVIFTKDQMMQYVKKLLLYVAVTAVAAVVTYGLCSLVNAGAVMQIIIKGVICLIVPNVIYLAVYYRTYEFKQTAALADKMLKGKVTFLKKLM